MDFDYLDSVLKEKHISRRKLALSLGISEGTMSTAFSRKSGLSSIDAVQIAKILDISVERLLGISDVGDKIRLARIKSGLTQEELANVLDVSRNTIVNYESGKTNPGVLMYEKILEVLNGKPNAEAPAEINGLKVETLAKVSLLNDLGIETLTAIIDNMAMLPMYRKKED